MTFAIAFDVETTGLEAGSRMVEIAALKVDIASGTITDRLCLLVNPQMPLPADAQCIHRIEAATLDNAPHAGVAGAKFLEFTEGAAFGAGHFAPYDVGVISWELERWGHALPTFPVVDTCDMAKAIKETANNKLPTLVEHYRITTSGAAHRAMADAEACWAYYQLACAKTTPRMKPWEPDHRYMKPVELPGHLRALPDLVAEGKPFPFAYTDGEGLKSHRTITPYGWSVVKGALMFHGLCHTRGERRTFRADRVDGAAA
jgi:DNA polymerase III epsilon subunit-like protein